MSGRIWVVPLLSDWIKSNLIDGCSGFLLSLGSWLLHFFLVSALHQTTNGKQQRAKTPKTQEGRDDQSQKAQWWRNMGAVGWVRAKNRRQHRNSSTQAIIFTPHQRFDETWKKGTSWNKEKNQQQPKPNNQSTSYNIQHTAYSIQHTTYSIHHTAYSKHHTAYIITIPVLSPVLTFDLTNHHRFIFHFYTTPIFDLAVQISHHNNNTPSPKVRLSIEITKSREWGSMVTSWMTHQHWFNDFVNIHCAVMWCDGDW